MRTSNSLGVSMRCMKVETLPSPAPIMIPMSSMACMLPTRSVSSQEYSSSDSPIMSTSWTTNICRLRAALSPATPKKNTVEVWMARYRDSNPMMDGVMMRLPVTVWKATVAMAWHTATTPMAMRAYMRRWAMSQKLRVPSGAGFFQMSSPAANRRASAVRPR